MKLVRVPWICCRADEVGAVSHEMEWRGRVFTLMAHSVAEGRDWWAGLSEAERKEALGMSESAEPDELSLF